MLDRRQFILYALGAIAGRAARGMPGAGAAQDVFRETCPRLAEMDRPLVGAVLCYGELCEIGASVDITDGWQQALKVGRVTSTGSLGEAFVRCYIDMNKVWEHVRIADVYGGIWSTEDKGETWQRIR